MMQLLIQKVNGSVLFLMVSVMEAIRLAYILVMSQVISLLQKILLLLTAKTA